jgi:hypothetical protein
LVNRKNSLSAQPARFAHNRLFGRSSPSSPTTQSCATGDFLKVYERPRIGGDLCDGSFSETASLQSAGRFCAFFSGPEIPFPGNGDGGWQRPVRLSRLRGSEAQHLVLPRPWVVAVGDCAMDGCILQAAMPASVTLRRSFRSICTFGVVPFPDCAPQRLAHSAGIVVMHDDGLRFDVER